MQSKASLVELPELHLVVSQAAEFPADLKGCWERLESKLPSLRGRKFYGLMFYKEGTPLYYAALETKDPQEIATLGFPTMTLKSGKYARVKLMDWPEHTDQIPEIFTELRSRYKKDGSKPDIEFYRSQTELYLLMPLAE